MSATRGFLIVSFFLYGLAFGSFANVVIWRLPRWERLSDPPSRCPRCGHPIRWYDNIPVVSWFVLRGRCRDCAGPIPIRYPLVEIASGALFGLAAAFFPEPGRAVAASAFFWFLLVLGVVDLDTMRLPDPIVAALGVVGVSAVAFAQLTGIAAAPLTPVASGPLAPPWAGALAGAALGLGTSLGIAWVYEAARKREGFGMGDVKLLGAMGLFLGPYVLFAFFAATFLGAVWGLRGMLAGRMGAQDRTPFGPFLAAGGVLAAVLGPPAVAWYLVWVGVLPQGAR